MNSRKKWIVIGIALAILLLGIAVVGVLLRTDPVPTPPTEGETTAATQPTEVTVEATQETDSTTEPVLPPEKQEDQSVTPPDDLPPSVTVPPVKDPVTGELELKFPCRVEEYGLVLEKLAPYSGMYVEDGSNANVSDVAMLLVKNEGGFPVEYTRICVQYGTQTLLFDISALPVKESVVVQESSGQAVPDAAATACTALVVQRAEMELSEKQVSITDNGDNTLTITNLTDQMIPTVRVFYKYYMKDENVFVGGIAFTVRVTRLAANSTVVIQPSHYTSQTSRVVMALTYDTEV